MTKPQRQWVVMFINPTTGDHTAHCVYEADTDREAIATMRRHICSTYRESCAMNVEEFRTACDIRERTMKLSQPRSQA